MKQPLQKVDQDKLNAFMRRIQKEARELFPDEDGNSLIDVNISDRTLYSADLMLPIPRLNLIDSEKDWIDIIDRLSCNVNTVSNTLQSALKMWAYRKMEEETHKDLIDELSKLGSSLDVKFIISGNLQNFDNSSWMTIPNKPLLQTSHFYNFLHGDESKQKAFKMIIDYITDVVSTCRKGEANDTFGIHYNSYLDIQMFML